jgi:hypothetical protein
MSGEKKLEEFLQTIDEWISCKNLPKVDHKEDIEALINMSAQDISHLSSKECLAYAYELYAYADHLESIKAKEKIALDWADSSIWYIISKSLDDYGNGYTKWEQKYYSAVKENPLAASEILKIKKYAEARLAMVEGKSNKVLRMADTLCNLSKTR